MSVVGIGTDILEIQRLASMPAASLHKLAKRVLTETEYQIYESAKFPIPFLAKRWAGKEALAKALGTGIAQGVSFQDITIENQPSGKPELTLRDKALQIAEASGASRWHISLSDEKEYAVAFVVLSTT